MRIRYSLRTLLIAVTLICLGIGWLALPTLRAREFVAAMAEDDYAAAEKLFTNQREVFPGGFKDHQIFDPRVILKPLTWRDLVHRERNIIVAVSYCDGRGMASCSVEIKATADGLEKGMALP
ncbi:MAG: hypothetical protein WEH44_09935 [Pirellulaceae bacterium]